MGLVVRRPDSVELAAASLAAESGSRIVAGGTLVIRALNEGTHYPTALVSLDRAGLTGIDVSGGSVRIGAATPIAALADRPELAFLGGLMRSFASPTVRNMATVGGNLFAPQPYGDLGVCLLALDATLSTHGPGGSRSVPLPDFYLFGLQPAEIVTHVAFALPTAGAWRFTKATRRELNSAAIVAVAAVVDQRDGSITDARIALGGVADQPVRAYDAERCLIGHRLDQASADAAGAAAAAAFPCFSDAYASAWYRHRVLPVHLRRALLGA